MIFGSFIMNFVWRVFCRKGYFMIVLLFCLEYVKGLVVIIFCQYIELLYIMQLYGYFFCIYIVGIGSEQKVGYCFFVFWNNFYVWKILVFYLFKSESEFLLIVGLV